MPSNYSSIVLLKSSCNSSVFLAVLEQSHHLQLSRIRLGDGSDSSAKLASVASESSHLLFFTPKVSDFDFAPIQNDDIVQLSAIESAKKVWVRAIKTDETYCELMRKVNSDDHEPVKLSELQNDTVVLVRYAGDYSRAIVVDAAEMQVQLMDIGSKVIVTEIGILSR